MTVSRSPDAQSALMFRLALRRYAIPLRRTCGVQVAQGPRDAVGVAGTFRLGLAGLPVGAHRLSNLREVARTRARKQGLGFHARIVRASRSSGM